MTNFASEDFDYNVKNRYLLLEGPTYCAIAIAADPKLRISFGQKVRAGPFRTN